MFYRDVKNGNADLLIIEGVGGTGKTKLVEDIMKEIPHVNILSHVTPMKLYITGYKYRNLSIIFDDVDTLLYNEQNVSLLKMFCETSEIKQIEWLTTHKLLEEEGIPQKYETKSKVMIICNDFAVITKKIQALKDRGWHLTSSQQIKNCLENWKK